MSTFKASYTLLLTFLTSLSLNNLWSYLPFSIRFEMYGIFSFHSPTIQPLVCRSYLFYLWWCFSPYSWGVWDPSTPFQSGLQRKLQIIQKRYSQTHPSWGFLMWLCLLDWNLACRWFHESHHSKFRLIDLLCRRKSLSLIFLLSEGIYCIAKERWFDLSRLMNWKGCLFEARNEGDDLVRLFKI